MSILLTKIALVPTNLFHERALKEAVHELGHFYGFVHCVNPKCVMHFSNSLQDTDYKDSHFCPECTNKLYFRTRQSR